jgi:putative DNA primase/helicase
MNGMEKLMRDIDRPDLIGEGLNGEVAAAIADAYPPQGRRLPQPGLSAKPGGDGVYLVRADQIIAEHVDYFDDGLIPLRVVTIVTGLDGVGKSTLLYTKAALATRGKLPGVFSGEPVDIVIASSEDHPGSVILPRLVAAGADQQRVHIIKCRRDGLEGDIALPDDLPGIEAKVREVGAGLLIVDPLVSYLPLSVDSHKAQHIRSVLAPLGHLAEDARLAVAAVVHFNGAASTDVRSRISGSKALRDASRSVLVCGEDPGDESRFVMVQDKHSFGPRSNVGFAYRLLTAQVEIKEATFTTSKLVWDGEVEIDSRGLLAGPGDPEERSAIDEATEFLLHALADGPRDAAETKKQAGDEGVKERTLHRARRDLHVVVDRDETRRGRPSTWRLPITCQGPRDGDGTKPLGTKPLTVETVTPQRIPGVETLDESITCQPPDGGTKPLTIGPLDVHTISVANARADEVRRKNPGRFTQ